jgi:hypothetical protein
VHKALETHEHFVYVFILGVAFLAIHVHQFFDWWYVLIYVCGDTCILILLFGVYLLVLYHVFEDTQLFRHWFEFESLITGHELYVGYSFLEVLAHLCVGILHL